MPVIGNICGPVSAAGTLIDMAKLLVEFLKKPEASHRFMQAVTDRLIPYARAQAEAGARRHLPVRAERDGGNPRPAALPRLHRPLRQ